MSTRKRLKTSILESDEDENDLDLFQNSPETAIRQWSSKKNPPKKTQTAQNKQIEGLTLDCLFLSTLDQF